MLENEVLHEVVLRDALAAHRAFVPVGFPETLEGPAPFRCRQTGHGPKQRGHENQHKKHQTATEASEEARARVVLLQLDVLRHPALARVAKGLKVDDVGEILAAKLQVNLRAVVLFVHLYVDQEHPVGVGDGSLTAELVAVHLVWSALHEDVSEHHRRVVAVGGLAGNAVRFGACERQDQHGQQNDQPDLAHVCWSFLRLIKC